MFLPGVETFQGDGQQRPGLVPHAVAVAAAELISRILWWGITVVYANRLVISVIEARLNKALITTKTETFN